MERAWRGAHAAARTRAPPRAVIDGEALLHDAIPREALEDARAARRSHAARVGRMLMQPSNCACPGLPDRSAGRRFRCARPRRPRAGSPRACKRRACRMPSPPATSDRAVPARSVSPPSRSRYTLGSTMHPARRYSATSASSVSPCTKLTGRPSARARSALHVVGRRRGPHDPNSNVTARRIHEIVETLVRQNAADEQRVSAADLCAVAAWKRTVSTPP